MRTLEEIRKMSRAELLTCMKNELDQLNLLGLCQVYYLTLNGLSETEKYNVHTSQKRLEKICQQQEEKQKEYERQKEEQEKVQEQSSLERLVNQDLRAASTIAGLQGAKKRFCDKIEQAKIIIPDRYNVKADELLLLEDLYEDNDYHIKMQLFYYGFYQGMQYIKNQNKRKKQVKR